VEKFVPGVYAVQVTGNLPVEIQEQLEDKGIKYRPRDGTAKD
jgi:transcription elongation factor SPT4